MHDAGTAPFRTLTAVAPLDPAAGPAELFALDPSDGGWRNRVCLLNLGGMMLGGHIIALGIKAAWLAAREALPHAVHALLLEGPDPGRPCELEVETIRDGRRLAHRTASIRQGSRTGARITTTLVHPELARSSPDYHHSAPAPSVPAPEDLPERQALINALPASTGPLRRGILQAYPYFDIREVPCDPGQDGRGVFWIRAEGARGLSPIDQFCLLALMTDYWFPLPTHHLPGAAEVMGADFVSSSLDHALWFNTQPDCSDWMLFDMRATAANGGLSTLRGEAWTRDGRALATFAQTSILAPGRRPQA
ncbi:hypothetical protein GVN24_19410 [Rhizobium sp. CRIBSB]|nr:hypothetical protein [Rhizobium sp. CRIBSB]